VKYPWSVGSADDVLVHEAPTATQDEVLHLLSEVCGGCWDGHAIAE
jgi:hypothetical protein